MFKLIKYGFFGLIAVFIIMSFFSDDEPDELAVIDLNVVLDEFIAVAESRSESSDAPPESAENTKEMGLFTKDYADQLNEFPLYEEHQVGIELREDGAFLGFVDDDENGTKDSGEAEVFTVELDSERQRLIATDLAHGYHRDSAVRMGAGFLGGMLLSRMLFNQGNAGVRSSRFSKMKMSPKNYHAQAKSDVNAKRTSARSKTGSGSFRSGK